MKKSFYITLFAIATDIMLLIISYILALKFGYRIDNLIDPMNIWLVFGWTFLWILIVLKLNLYEIPRFVYLDKLLIRNSRGLAIFFMIIAASLFFLKKLEFSSLVFIYFIISFSILLLTWRIMCAELSKTNRKRGFGVRKVVMVGLNENIERIINLLTINPQFGYQIKALFSDPVENYSNISLKKYKLNEVYDYCENNNIEEMIVSLPNLKSNMVNDLLKFGDNKLIRVIVIPEFSEYLSQIFSIEYVDNIPIMRFRREPLESLANKIIKRGFDIFFSLFVIIFIFSWLFPIIALIIKLTSEGPIFFKQLRNGKGNKAFNCLKFRTMIVNGNSDEIQATVGDERITKFGAFLRRTSLDELPQFFNVLKKNMSVVGPRPHMLKHTSEYRTLVDKFMVRHFVKPGITGWAQINGFRGETREISDMENRVKADIWYIENWNFFLDLKIIFLTFIGVLKKDENAF